MQALDNTTFAKLIGDFYAVLVRYWSPSLFPEIGNYGAEHYLEALLSKKITDRSEILRVTEIITAPEESSFYQIEEMELSECNDLGAHQQKYFWLKNSHNHVEILPVSYFAERKKLLYRNLSNIVKGNLEKMKERKALVQSELNLDKQIMEIADMIGKNIVWQDRRKMNTFISLHFKYKLLQEASRRFAISEDALFNLNLSELGELANGKDFSNIFAETKELEFFAKRILYNH